MQAALDLAQAVIPDMRAAGRGAIINLSSASSVYPAPPPAMGVPASMTIYGASKAALERITIGLAAELYDDRIGVTTLAPVAAVARPCGALGGSCSRSTPSWSSPSSGWRARS